MSLSRFYLPPPDWPSSGDITLPDDEASHCVRVLRKGAGDEIEVFDGAGRVARALITEAGRSAVRARVVSMDQFEPLRPRLHLLPALIKGDAFEWMIEKAVELGAASVRPLITQRTVVHVGAEQLEKKMARWRRHMLEAAKQCHTPFLSVLAPPRSLAVVCAALPERAMKVMPALSERGRTLREAVLSSEEGAAIEDVVIAIGPEGDFTKEEEDQARQAGFVPVTLGPLVLRAETAAVAALAVLADALRRDSR